MKPDKKERAPNILQVTQRFNEVRGKTHCFVFDTLFVFLGRQVCRSSALVLLLVVVAVVLVVVVSYSKL